MSAILVNYKDVVTPKSPLFNAITSPPDCRNGFLPGLVLVLSPTCLATLTGLPLGPQRLDYINSPSFINGIQTHLFVCYNPHRDLCLLDGSTLSSLSTVLPLLNQTLSPETLLWTSVDVQSPRLEETLRLLISNGFNTPFWTARSPLRSTISPSVALTRSNKSISSQFSPDTVLRKALDAANRNSVNTACLLTAKLSERAVTFLKRASKSGIVRDRNGKPSQREMTGELVVKDVVSEMDGFVYLIDIDKQSVKTGGPENVNVSATRYNFHSHPEEAYIMRSEYFDKLFVNNRNLMRKGRANRPIIGFQKHTIDAIQAAFLERGCVYSRKLTALHHNSRAEKSFERDLLDSRIFAPKMEGCIHMRSGM